jgi:plasmid replication initiation protein
MHRMKEQRYRSYSGIGRVLAWDRFQEEYAGNNRHELVHLLEILLGHRLVNYFQPWFMV